MPTFLGNFIVKSVCVVSCVPAFEKKDSLDLKILPFPIPHGHDAINKTGKFM
jgi:hypothetical protein